MKKMIRVMALVMALVIVGGLLVACGKTLSGTYSAEVIGSGVSYEFKGNKVTVTVKTLGAELGSAEGTYKIADDKITFEFDSEDDDVKKYSGTFDFEEGEDYIKIGTFGKFTKKD